MLGVRRCVDTHLEIDTCYTAERIFGVRVQPFGRMLQVAKNREGREKGGKITGVRAS